MKDLNFGTSWWLRPGSFLWLTYHDLRLAWRDGISGLAGKSHRRAVVIAVLGIGILHLVAWKLAMPLLPRLAGDGAMRLAEAPGGIALALIALVAWMTAQGLNGSARTIYDRGDLDLLLASPVSPAAVLAARMVVLATSSYVTLALLALPIAHVGTLIDSPRWLALYPILAIAAVLGTALGAALAMAIVAWLGARRARRASSIIASIIAGIFVLGGQLLFLLPERVQQGLWDVLQEMPRALLPAGVGILPIEAALGDVPSLVVLSGVTIIIFAIAAVVLGRRFAATCRLAAGASEDNGGETALDGSPLGFRSGVQRALMVKEWRLLRRDPSLVQQLALQLVYTMPIVVIMMRSDANLPLAIAIGPALVVIAAQLTGSLAWIATSGEDAPELIAAAPVKQATVERAKIAAVAIPVALFFAVPIMALAMVSLEGAAKTALIVMLSSVSAVLINLWYQKPANKRGLLRRHTQSKLAAIIEHTLALLWAVALVLILMGSLVTVVPVVLAVLVLVAISPRVRRLSWRTASRPAAQVSAAARQGAIG